MKNQFIKKLLLLNFKIFPLLASIAFLFLFFETYMYIGFIRKFVIFDSRYFMVAAIISAGLLIFQDSDLKSKKKNYYLTTLFFRLNKLFFPLVFVVYLVMQLLETANYPNYVYSMFHLQPDNFFYIVLFSASLFVIGKFKGNNNSSSQLFVFVSNNIKLMKKRDVSTFIYITLLFSTFYLIFNSFNTTFINSIESNLHIFSNLDASYKKKMHEKWGLLYRFIFLIEENSKENASIILPPKEFPHNVDSRTQYYRYFFGNRKLVNYSDEINIYEYDFVAVTKGYLHPVHDGEPKKNYIWPDFEIDSQKFIYIYKDASNELKRDVWYGKYNPSHFMDEDIWGLIEVRKD